MAKVENFEEKIVKINKLLEIMDNKDINLNDSVKLYKEGVKLIKEAREILENAKLEIKHMDVEDE